MIPTEKMLSQTSLAKVPELSPSLKSAENHGENAALGPQV